MALSEAGHLTEIHLSVDTKLLQSLYQSLDEAIESGMPELHERFAKTLAERAEKAFDSEGYPEPWKPSAASIKENRKTLQKTKRLMKSLTELGGENFFVSFGNEMMWGTWVPYAPYHFDEDQARVLRQLIVFDDDLNRQLDDDMDDWLREIIARNT